MPKDEIPTKKMLKTISPIKYSLFFLLVSFAVLFAPTWAALIDLWSKMDFAYSHGAIALLLACLYLFRAEIPAAQNSKLLAGIFACLIALGSTTWFASNFLQIQIGAQLIVLVLLVFTLAGIYGLKSVPVLFPAFLYLFFSIPVWDYLSPTLQNLTTFIATNFMEATGLAIFVEGNRITIPYGTFEIAGGCSGLRYFLVSLVLVLFYSLQRPSPVLVKVYLFGIAILFSLLANWIRVISIILIGYETQMQSDIVEDHETFGWIIYILTFVPGVYLMNRIEKKGIAHSRENNAKSQAIDSNMFNINPRIYLATLLALSVGPVLSATQSFWTTPLPENYQFETLDAPTGWSKIDQANPPWRPHFRGADFVEPIEFQHDSHHTIFINAVYFKQEAQGRELVNDLNRIANEKIWSISSPDQSSAKPHSIPVDRYVIKNSTDGKLLVNGYYQIGADKLIGALRVKLAQLFNLFSDSHVQAYIAYGINCKTDCEKASGKLSAFIDDYEKQGSILKHVEIRE